MDKKFITGLLVGAAVAGLISYTKNNTNDEKTKLVALIMQKYGNAPGFEGTPEILMNFDVNTLRGILSGEIQ